MLSQLVLRQAARYGANAGGNSDRKECDRVRADILFYFLRIWVLVSFASVNVLLLLLCRLMYDTTLAELTSSEEMMRSMKYNEQIHPVVISKLWQVCVSTFPYLRSPAAPSGLLAYGSAKKVKGQSLV